VNNFLRDNNLFPSLPEGTTGRYVISGLRHSFDERMDKALMTNEERAQLMGHSISKLRGRPVYGAKLNLIMRSLLQELVGIEGDGWKPRPRAEVREEINRLIEAAGYRLR
jgi:integrase